MLDASHQTVGLPSERTLDNVKRATAHGVKIGARSYLWKFWTGYWYLRPFVEDVTGPWWEGKAVLTVRSVIVYWLCFGVAMYWPVTEDAQPLEVRHL